MSRFTEFTRERCYLHNVSLATVSWYTRAFKWLPSESPTQADLKDAVMRCWRTICWIPERNSMACWGRSGRPEDGRIQLASRPPARTSATPRLLCIGIISRICR
jgi:hypothetical protein